jgi:Uma2 family endonuclease
MTENTIVLKLPKGVRFNDPQIEEIKRLNNSVEVRKGRQGASLVIKEKDFIFEEVDFFEFYTFEGYTCTEKQLEALWRRNDELLLETNPDRTIIFKMFTSLLISSFSACVGGSLGIWNLEKKLGRVTGGKGVFIFPVSLKSRVPDLAYTSFEKMKKVNKWKSSYAKIAATLCIEILSNNNARELEKNLAKMQNDWMPEGTDIGLVVDPFGEKYYMFEKGMTGQREIDFSIPFTHNLLPDLILDFGDLLKQVFDQNPDVELP